MKKKSIFLAATAAAMLLGSTQAATITWGGANLITGNAGTGIAMKNFQPDNNITYNTTTGTADIYNAGTSVLAVNFNGIPFDSWSNRVTFFENTPQSTTFVPAASGGLTQNGVTLSFGAGWSGDIRFVGSTPQGDSYGTNPGYTYETLAYMRYAGTSASLTLSGLALGQNYAIQYWVQDNRSFGVNRTLTLDGQTTLDFNNDSGSNPGSGIGQWAVGTFTANSTSQTINITANESAQVNLFQLRAIPEPSTALLGLAALGGMTLRRRR